MATRKERKIVEDWVQILTLLYMFAEGLSSSQLAEKAKRVLKDVSADLRNMRTRHLIHGCRQRGKFVWLVNGNHGNAEQISFFPGVVTKAKKTAIPSRAELRQMVLAARPGQDLREKYWVIKAKATFRKSTEVAGGHITWKVADEHLHDYHRGDPREIIRKLENGEGATVTWSCGCKLTLPWNNHVEPQWELCPGVVCERAVHQFQAVTANPVALVQVNSSLIYLDECWRADNPPDHKSIGQSYTRTCGCVFVVSEVVCFDESHSVYGVIAADRGHACKIHHEEIQASREFAFP